MKKYFIICSLSLLLSLYLFEGYLKFFSSDFDLNRKVKIYEKNSSNKYDKRTKVQIYKDLKKIFDDVSVTVPPKTYVMHPEKDIFPLSGLANSKTIHCNENGYYSIFKSDRHGFNNPDEEWNNDEIEYILVGDSLTQGECVNRPNDISSVLRILSNKSVLNLGYSGNGPLIQYATLKEYINKNIKVKNILWFYYEGNDMEDLKTSSESIILNQYILDKDFKQNLKTKQKKIDQLSKMHIDKYTKYIEGRLKKKNKYTILRFIRLDKTKKLIKNLIDEPQDDSLNNNNYKKLKKILKLSKDLAFDNNSMFHVIYLPHISNFINKNLKSEKFHKEKIENILAELDINFIDVTKIFKKDKNPLKYYPFELPGHFNVEGYKAISLEIYKQTSSYEQ